MPKHAQREEMISDNLQNNQIRKNLIEEEQDRFLSELLENHLTISLYLIHGIKLTGKIVGFSDKAIFLGAPIPQAVYKSSISTIIPTKV